MKKTVIFAGTYEGRILAQRLAAKGEKIWVSVATEYGRELLPQGENILPHAGRLEPEEMKEYLEQEGFEQVVDATHPYAAQVSQNLRRACAQAKVDYLRLAREPGDCRGCTLARDAAQAAELCREIPGNILLTTGAKELAAFGEEELVKRLYPRVLPLEESLEACRRLGVEPAHIIAMQGPFSTQLNLALMHQLNIRVMVTKDGGRAGGLAEKLEAARLAGVRVILIPRPGEEEGLSLEEVEKRLSE